jgi:hypothetical protein
MLPVMPADEVSLNDVALLAGRIGGALAMAPPGTVAASAQRQLSVIWEVFRRDAGTPDVGREHHVSSDLLVTDDPRRDGLLLWLADHARAPLADAAALTVKLVSARRRFDADQQAMLSAALDLQPPLPDTMTVTAITDWLLACAAALRVDARFAETSGEAFALALPRGRYDGFRAAEPGGCWAANLAIAARTVGLPIPPGSLSRMMLRLDLEPEDRAAMLIPDWHRGLERADHTLFATHRELVRGATALAGLSKNARARDAWSLIVGLGSPTRAQLTRALDLSRGGGALVVRHLVEAGLVLAHDNGRLMPREDIHRSERQPIGGLALATQELDAAMEDIERLLRTSSTKFDCTV